MKSQLSQAIEQFESQFLERLDDLDKSKADKLQVLNSKEKELKEAEMK